MAVYAVIGLGSISKRHLSNLRNLHPDATIYAVSSSGRNSNLPKDADAIISVDELAALKPDYVIVASPAPFHVDTAIKLIRSNVPVLIEKPLAHDYSTCCRLTEELARNPDAAVAVGYCLRFLPSAKVVKQALENNALGQIYNASANVGQYLPHWRTDKSYKDSVSAKKALGGGALLELSHEFDYLSWLFGDMEVLHSWLRSSTELGLEVEDIADVVLLTNSNVYITVHLDFVQKNTQRKCEIIGERGRLVWDLIANTVQLFSGNGLEVLYSDSDYNKNLMYLDMLQEFEKINTLGLQELASPENAANIVKLIDTIKMNSGSNLRVS